MVVLLKERQHKTSLRFFFSLTLARMAYGLASLAARDKHEKQTASTVISDRLLPGCPLVHSEEQVRPQDKHK